MATLYQAPLSGLLEAGLGGLALLLCSLYLCLSLAQKHPHPFICTCDFFHSLQISAYFLEGVSRPPQKPTKLCITTVLTPVTPTLPQTTVSRGHSCDLMTQAREVPDNAWATGHKRVQVEYQ